MTKANRKETRSASMADCIDDLEAANVGLTEQIEELQQYIAEAKVERDALEQRIATLETGGMTM